MSRPTLEDLAPDGRLYWATAIRTADTDTLREMIRIFSGTGDQPIPSLTKDQALAGVQACKDRIKAVERWWLDLPDEGRRQTRDAMGHTKITLNDLLSWVRYQAEAPRGEE